MTINILDAFENEPPALDFVLPGFVKGTVGMLTSAGGVGKSFLAMEACLGIADAEANEALIKLPISSHGPVAILNAEDQADVLKSRLHALGKYLNKETRLRLRNNFILEDLYGRGCNILSEEWQAKIIELLKSNNVRLCVLDTLSRWHQLNENDNGDMGKLMSALDMITRETGSSILLLHHINKGMAKEGRQDEQQSARGASLLVDNARWQAWMGGMSEEDAKLNKINTDLRKYYVQFGISKQNSGSPFNELWLKRFDGGVLLPVEIKAKMEKRWK
jgi:RecA-family ATPase